MSDRGEAAVDDLLKLFDSEQSADVKRTILQTLSDIKSTRVEDKLFEVAKGNDTIEVKRQAIRLLGERASKRSFEFLSATAQSTDGNAEVQVQAVRAISERRAEESVPILIKIARTHPNQAVRKQAIRSLGESGDPRAIDFFKEVLTNEIRPQIGTQIFLDCLDLCETLKSLRGVFSIAPTLHRVPSCFPSMPLTLSDNPPRPYRPRLCRPSVAAPRAQARRRRA